MSKNDTAAVEAIDLSNDRAIRALTEHMSVLPESADLYTVVGEHGGTYTVDLRDGVCGCPDSLHRGVECKHQLRARAATGRLAIPGWIDRSAVDPLLGAHVETDPRVAATDGGIIEAGDDGEILDADPDPETETETETDGGRPEDCTCDADDLDIACPPCYLAGFDFDDPADTDTGMEGSA